MAMGESCPKQQRRYRTNIKDLSPEILKKAEACNTAEELFALAKAEGIELSDEDIAEIAGGGYLHSPNSPKRERRAWGSDEGSSGE